MKTLNEILCSPFQAEAFATDLVGLIDQHLASVRGLRGIGLKTGMAVLKSAKPDLLDGALRRNAPQFIAALQPLYEKFLNGSDRDFAVFLQKHSAEAGEALMGVADARVAKSSNAALQAAYRRLRSTAESELEAIVPSLGKLIRGYL